MMMNLAQTLGTGAEDKLRDFSEPFPISQGCRIPPCKLKVLRGFSLSNWLLWTKSGYVHTSGSHTRNLTGNLIGGFPALAYEDPADSYIEGTLFPIRTCDRSIGGEGCVWLR